MAEISLKKLIPAISEIDVIFNDDFQGVADTSIPLSVNLTDGLTDITPTSVGLIGNELDIEIPSYELDLTDRFGNVFSAVNIQGNSNVDLRTLTPYDFADIYLSTLTNPPTGVQLAAVYTYFNDMASNNLFQGSTKIDLCIGGNAADHSINARYPFLNNSSNISNFIGSPTHNANGVSLNGLTQAVRTNTYVSYLQDFNKQISIYTRDNIINPIGGIIFNAGLPNSLTGFGIIQDSRNRYYTEGIQFGPNLTNALGLTSLSRESSTVIRYRQNSINLSGSPLTAAAIYNKVTDEITIGSYMNQSLVFSNFKEMNYCYFRVGNALTDAQELIHYNIVQALQTAFSRQV